MAEISRLAHKQMEYLFDSNPKAHFEKRILNDAIFFPFQKRGAFVLCTSSNIGEIIQRLNEFHLIVIGIQTDIKMIYHSTLLMLKIILVMILFSNQYGLAKH